MPDLVSITDAAKRVGLSRPRLSKIIKAHEVKKVKNGGSYLVDPVDIINLVDRLKAEGKVRDKEVGRQAPQEPHVVLASKSASNTQNSSPSADLSLYQEIEKLKLQMVALESELNISQEKLAFLEKHLPKNQPNKIGKDTAPFWKQVMRPWG